MNKINSSKTLAYLSFGLSKDLVPSLLTDYKEDLTDEQFTAFCSRNTDTVFLLVNCWLSIAEEAKMPTIFISNLRQVLLRRGLKQAIQLASNAADYLISLIDEDQWSSMPSLLYEEDSMYLTINHLAECTGIEEQVILQVLRFPKRFAPVGVKSLNEMAIAKFDAINTSNVAQSQSNWKLPNFIDNIVRDELSKMTEPFCRILGNFQGSFSAGVSLIDMKTGKTSRETADKLTALAYEQHCLYDNPMYPLVGSQSTKFKDSNGKLHIMFNDMVGRFGWKGQKNLYFRNPNPTQPFNERYVITVKSVPKNYKTGRIIAPEHPYASFHLQKVRKALEECLNITGYSEYFDVRNADVNRTLCRLASINRRMSCTDLSSASDSISVFVAMRVFPQAVLQEILPYRPNYIRYPDNTYTNNGVFLTSGNPCCFICEGMFFLAVYRAAEYLCSMAYPDLEPSRIFGDDGICDTRIIDTVDEILQYYGVSLNWDKTYSGHYRENCGVEYYDGLLTTAKYWPRKVIDLDNQYAEGIASLISLQHRLFYEYPNTAALLTEAILDLFPKMTASLPNSNADDLWDIVPRGVIKNRPGSRDGSYTIEKHYTMSQKSKEHIRSNNEEMYLYTQYLQSGPQYEDDLSRRLGVTSRRKLNTDTQSVFKLN